MCGAGTPGGRWWCPAHCLEVVGFVEIFDQVCFQAGSCCVDVAAAGTDTATATALVMNGGNVDVPLEHLADVIGAVADAHTGLVYQLAELGFKLGCR